MNLYHYNALIGILGISDKARIKAGSRGNVVAAQFAEYLRKVS